MYRGGGKPGRKAKQPYRVKTHGMTRSPTYRSWEGAKQRCYNPNAPKYQQYGGLGITMHGPWRNSFPAFLADMGERPPSTTLDRWPNPFGNYEPGNCRWATIKEQRANRRAERGIKPPSEKLSKREKLTADNVLAIRADTRPYPIIATDYQISLPNVYHIKTHATWKHL